ncbi:MULTISPECIES: Gfo/Idh/MocA family oxidoreductase [Rhodomicrobium]|uniref:Gfo/Idh/MocA family protein n=1 Tax=Rhodomicrobium TaxID=1068 RepID=UPI000B4BADAA|nr:MULTISPECIES: Gfo/Idh/MocA family oxidoreductase [Rhodomicrobium]
MAKPLRVALIGTGFMGKCHALAWNAVAPVFGDVPRPELALLCEAGAELAAARAAEFGFARASGDWRDAVAAPDIDVVSITTPNAFHPEMAIAALEAGKHVWCEKPMAPAFADAERMNAAAQASGKVAALGYNYIQNPIIRLMARLLGEGAIGRATHLRVEMDEDFMADGAAPFDWKHAATSGYGALDDFGVHAFSLLRVLGFEPRAVTALMTKPYADRATGDGSRRAVETHDVASLLLRFDGLGGTILLNRSAWGRKGRIFVQIFGTAGSIVYDQERFNEVQLYTADGPRDRQGFRSILAGPVHPPYEKFIPAPGHGLGFNELKVIECRELLRAIAGEPAHLLDFSAGLEIERAVHAAARSHESGQWVDIG